MQRDPVGSPLVKETTGRILAAAGIAAALSAACGAAGSGDGGPALGWARRGTFFAEARQGDLLVLEYRAIPGGEDLVSLYAPDGRRLRAVRLARGASGRERMILAAGDGTYRLTAGPGHRLRVRLPPGRALAFEPETQFPAFFQRRGEGGPYWLRVEGTDSLLLVATNQNDFEGSAGRVTVRDPRGEPAGELRFDRMSEAELWRRLGTAADEAAFLRLRADTVNVPQYRVLAETLRVPAPRPGVWRIEAGVEGRRADDIGFWLRGVPNRVWADSLSASRSPADAPGAVRARAEVLADSVRGPAGELGVVWDWPSSQEEARRAFLAMGVRADNHFLPQSYLEPVNDDPSPWRTREAGFLFSGWRHRMAPLTRGDLRLTSLMCLTRPAPWAAGRPEEFAEFAEAAVAWHAALPGLDPDRLYWALGNEPNHETSARAYAELYSLVGRRLRASPSELVRRARFGGPAIGNAEREPGVLDLAWVRELLDAADPYVDFICWNQYRLPRLEETWRYAELVRETRAICDARDRDGRREEILIGATNMKGGVVLHNERQDGFENALWWASVAANALGTGDVRLLNYFYLVDEGSRRKGLLFADGRWKPAARMMALLNETLGAEVVAAASDHSEVEILATRGGEGQGAPAVSLLLVNKLDRPAALDPLRVRLPSGWTGEPAPRARRYADGDEAPVTLAPEAWKAVPAEAGWWAARLTLPPRSVIALRLAR